MCNEATVCAKIIIIIKCLNMQFCWFSHWALLLRSKSECDWSQHPSQHWSGFRFTWLYQIQVPLCSSHSTNLHMEDTTRLIIFLLSLFSLMCNKAHHLPCVAQSTHGTRVENNDDVIGYNTCVGYFTYCRLLDILADTCIRCVRSHLREPSWSATK